MFVLYMAILPAHACPTMYSSLYTHAFACRWAPAMAEYGVGGVPRFVFMDGDNEPLTAAVGRLPRKALEGACGAAFLLQLPGCRCCACGCAPGHWPTYPLWELGAPLCAVCVVCFR